MAWNQSVINGPLSIPVYGPVDPKTGQKPITGVAPGYHLNIFRGMLSPELENFEIVPNTPMVIFAGDEIMEDGKYKTTAFLSFSTEEEARELLADLWVELPELP